MGGASRADCPWVQARSDTIRDEGTRASWVVTRPRGRGAVAVAARDHRYPRLVWASAHADRL